MSATTPAIDGATSSGSGVRHTRLGSGSVLLLLCVAQFMVVLDVSIVNVALPSIRHALGFSQTALQWIVNAYALAFAGFLLLGGRLGDLLGRRRMFMVGLGCFTASSLLCGAAHFEGVMIGARAAQGLSAALLSPATLSILTTTFPEGSKRTRAMGLWSATAAAGGVAGALIGGVVTQELSWRWIFLVNIPIGLLVLVAARSVLPADAPTRGRGRPDLLGAVMVTSGLVLLVYGITQSATHGWGTPRVIAPIIVGVAKLCAFVVIEWRVARHPLMPLSLFGSRSLRAANVAVLLVSSAMFAVWFFMTLYLQNVLGYDPLEAGLAFLPSGFAVIAGTQVSSRLIRRIGSRPLLIGAPLMISGGMLWFARLSVHGTYAAHVLGPSVVTMLGFGMAFVPLTMAAMSGVSRDLTGIASGVFNTSRQVGGAIGLAVLGTIAVDRTKAVLAAGHATHAAALSAMADGYARAFLVGAIVAACAAPLAALAAPTRIRSPHWWRHAMCAVAGQPWRCEPREQPAS